MIMKKISLTFGVACFATFVFMLGVYQTGQLDVPGFSKRHTGDTSMQVLQQRVEQPPSEILQVVSTRDQEILPNVQRKRRLTIGIPTIQRHNHSYFLDMIGSMFDKTSKEDLKEIVFVVFLADINNTIWKSEIENTLMKKYSTYIKDGSLIIIQAPATFYESMPAAETMKRTWQIKQNFDYAYLMKYCEHLSMFYMQMEDDIIAAEGYYTVVNDFMTHQSNDNWICLEFSHLGFIGKLYHSVHIVELATEFLRSCATDPVDELYIPFNIRKGQKDRLIKHPTLFQHMGYHSSLHGKVQPLRDLYFNQIIPLLSNDLPEKLIKGDNPPARVSTSLTFLAGFNPQKSYSEERGYFWSSSAPKVNDTFTIVFDSPHALKRVLINTGSTEVPDDHIRNGVLEASSSVIHQKGQSNCLNYVQLGSFENGSVDISFNRTEKKMQQVFKTRCLQIRFTKSQHQWIIVKEIAVYLHHY